MTAPRRVGADLLIVFAPGVPERFESFRLGAGHRTGEVSPQEIFGSQGRFDNHFVESAVWRSARTSR